MIGLLCCLIMSPFYVWKCCFVRLLVIKANHSNVRDMIYAMQEQCFLYIYYIHKCMCI